MARRIAAVGLVTVSERRSTYPLSAMRRPFRASAVNLP